MDLIHDNSFTVYVRSDQNHGLSPDAMEQPLTTCGSYAEARQILLQCRREAKTCVIRFDGIAGGGD